MTFMQLTVSRVRQMNSYN